ncbi:MAG: hypothetical protein RML56_07410 [Burkholderiales bacterium]|nr:hypothetical protein [Burkholderiales bacterium]
MSRHLVHLFAVEGVAYERLEVSSPGLDRPLSGERDFARFAGRPVSVRLRSPDAAGRRRYTGVLRGARDGVATLEVNGAGGRAAAGRDRARAARAAALMTTHEAGRGAG